MKKRKKKHFIIFGVFLVILLLNFSAGLVLGADDENDDDGINDDFEEENKRDIEIEFDDSEFQIESYLRNGDIIDEIQLKVKFDDDGVSIKISYQEESEGDDESEESTEFELEFKVEFRKLIEYIDLNANGMYDELFDRFIQEVALTSFKPVVYTLLNISNDTSLHYIIVKTIDSIFTAHIYVNEEFTLVNNSLITPSQIKINIEIKNFTYLNSNSQLALYTKLESEFDFEEEDETEDEREGYAQNEQGVITKVNQHTGIFTWQENATIDGISHKVFTNTIETDDEDEDDQKIFFNYLHGDHIFHDPKIGIEGLLTSDSPKGPMFPLIMFITIISIIGALSASIAYSIYHYAHNKHPSLSRYINKDFHTVPSRDDLLNKKLDFQIFEGNNIIENLIKLEDVNITAISEDFVDIIDKFEMETSERNEFINEMLSLSPNERISILNKMIKKTRQNL